MTKVNYDNRHYSMIFRVKKALHKDLVKARIKHEQTALKRQIEATDRQIDALVYELGVYPTESRRMVGDGGRLGEEEIAIVEGGADGLG